MVRGPGTHGRGPGRSARHRSIWSGTISFGQVEIPLQIATLGEARRTAQSRRTAALLPTLEFPGLNRTGLVPPPTEHPTSATAIRLGLALCKETPNGTFGLLGGPIGVLMGICSVACLTLDPPIGLGVSVVFVGWWSVGGDAAVSSRWARAEVVVVR